MERWIEVQRHNGLVLSRVSADMPELVECRMCGCLTRTEWRLEDDKGRVLGELWACPEENPDVVWNRILSKGTR